MALSKSRILVRGQTPHPHEAEAIDFIIGTLPDNEPYSVWALVELIDPSGRLYEVDALILGYHALYLIEIKSHPGVVRGNVVDWEHHFPDGGISVRENPLRLATQKARVLASRLDQKMGPDRPWVEPMIFLSHPDVKVELKPEAQLKVVTRANFARAITHGDFYGASPAISRSRVAQTTARATRSALRDIGLSPSKGALKVGELLLGEILEEGPGYQDRDAHHEQLREMHRRVRLYVIPASTTSERRDQLRRAAEREATVLTVLGDHQNILACKDYLRDGPTGTPCVVFDQFEDALPLDAFLRQHPDLSFDDRIAILRQIGEALDYCHRKQFIHRGLSPGAVLVRRRGNGGGIDVRLYNFQLAVRPESSIGTGHLSVLTPAQAEVYRAPEVIEDPDKASPASDVFSLGAIAYLVLTRRPPGEDVTERQKLLDRGRLSVAAASDALAAGAAGTDETQRKNLDDVIGMATEANPIERADSAIAWVNLLLEASTAPAPVPEAKVDPLKARAGDRLEQDLEVVKVLGVGSSARVLHVVQGESTNYALKVPLSPDLEQRLFEEGRVLDHVRSEHIVAKAGSFRVGGRQCLLVTYAGETLAERLAREGPVSLDYAQRWGNDLIQALRVLEEHAIQHRDIKPANLGVSTGPAKKALHLMLFDFSLAATDPRAVTTGTPAYRDPFLIKRGRWDEAADRYAAAVTLHEMLTGIRPRFGRGDVPAVATDEEVTLDAERFDPSVRARLVAFFRKALARDVANRHPDAESMHADWSACFSTTIAAAADEGERPPLTHDALRRIGLDAAVESLPLSVRARNALDRSGVFTVGDLLQIPMNRLSAIRRVGRETSREILDLVRVYRETHPAAAVGPQPEAFGPDYRGPNVRVSAIPSLPAEAVDALEDAGLARVAHLVSAPRLRVERILAKFPGAAEALERFLAVPVHIGVPVSIEDWLDQLLPAPHGRGETFLKHVRMLFGLDTIDSAVVTEAVVLARKLGITPAAIYIALSKARERWLAHPHLPVLHEALAPAIESVGGVAAVSRIAEVLPSVIPHAAGVTDGPAARRAAAALARIAGETGRATTLARIHGALWLGLTAEHVDAARRLGVCADDIAGREPLPSSGEVRDALERVARATLLAGLSGERLASLAAEASARAARSARLELYPRDMPAARSIKLCAGAFAGRLLTPAQVTKIVSSRYPEAEAIPNRPALDALLSELGFDWRPDKGAYLRRGVEAATATVTPLARRPTTHTPHRAPTSPEVEEAEEFEHRLRVAVERRDFRVLAVNAVYAEQAAEGLAHRLGVQPYSLERELLDSSANLMRERDIDPAAVYETDRAGPDGADWSLLRELMTDSADQLSEQLLREPGPLLLIHPGLLARYQLGGFVQRLIEAPAVAAGWRFCCWCRPSRSLGSPPSTGGRTISPFPCCRRRSSSSCPSSGSRTRTAGERRSGARHERVESDPRASALAGFGAAARPARPCCWRGRPRAGRALSCRAEGGAHG